MTTTVLNETVIVTIAATGNTNDSSVAEIPYFPGRTIVLASVSGPNDLLVRLPAGAVIGDVVEIYSDANGGVGVCPPFGEHFYNGASDTSGGPSPGIHRKVTSTLWAFK